MQPKGWSSSPPTASFRLCLSFYVSALGVTAAAGTLTGSVRDASGLPLAGAAVVLRGHGSDRTATAGADGRYTFADVPSGTFEASFRFPGFMPLRKEVVVADAEPATADVTLHLSATAEVVVTGRATFRDLATIADPDAVIGLAAAASNGLVSASQLEHRPVLRAGDLLERVPGVVISQHSGEGKANQYYVRGFNLDHGTDLAVTVAGLPVNMPTHGHGQGYADANFLIPELIGAIQYKKGPYYAEEGDFASAGAVNVTYLNVLDRPLVVLDGGENRYGRALVAAAPRVGDGDVLAALEVLHNDGPWDNPDGYRRLNGLLRYTRGTAQNGFSLTGMAYDARWDSTDQVPRRAVENGVISRFGAIDRTDGGESHRLSASFEWQRTGGSAMSRVQGYAIDYGMNLFSNFTYNLDDPENGDQFEQEDDRKVFGLKASRQWLSTWGERDAETTIGLQVRRDDIGAVGLFRTRARERLETVRQDAVVQTGYSLYAQTSYQWANTVRTIVGLRADHYRFAVDAGDPANAGAYDATRLSPKATLILGPWGRTEAYANFGYGFHSNDGRGTTIARDPGTGEPASRADPLVPAVGAEVGLRTLPFKSAHTTLAVWGLDIDSELLFIGDAGTTEASRPSRRVGVEWSADFRPRPWLMLDTSAAWSRARFRDADPAGDRIPGAVEGVVSAGVGVDDLGKWAGSLRLRYFGPRPLIEDDSIRSEASALVNLELGYALTDKVLLRLDVFNLFDAEASDIDYFYTSRLPGEPAEGVDDFHTHPVEPFTVRAGIKATF